MSDAKKFPRVYFIILIAIVLVVFLPIIYLASLFRSPPPVFDAPYSVPVGARHNDNFCGMSAFIHSMQSYFPGALHPNVTTDASEWDKVGDNLDHSNWFGERGGKFEKNVNKNYRDGNAAYDGKHYCAAEIKDTSPLNLANWAEDCNVKMLIYEYNTFFGHWVDVTYINGTRITVQDYWHNYDAELNEDGSEVDFSGAPSGSVMGGQFSGGDHVAGDSLFESVYFYAVCECVEDEEGVRGMPSVTGSGETLNR